MAVLTSSSNLLLASSRRSTPRPGIGSAGIIKKDRVPICFAALKNLSGQEKHLFESLTETTNAKENINRTFRNLMMQQQMELGDMVVLLVQYFSDQDMTLRIARGVVALGYGQNMSPNKRKRKAAFFNDGRPPDTTSTLLQSKKKKKIIQPNKSKEPIIAALQRLGKTLNFLASRGV
jgi:hypothetical protein